MTTTTTTTVTPATLDDLMRFDGKAELINGRIVPIMPTGYLPGMVSRRITRSLEDWVEAVGIGKAIPDGVAYGFSKPLPSGRQSFCPDSSLFTGKVTPEWMGYIDGHPVFAAEVRSANDYGPKMNAEYEAKRKDYFFAGTLVVWDVDPRAKTVTKYAAADPLTPVVFVAGQAADAEPAVPGWVLPIDALFA